MKLSAVVISILATAAGSAHAAVGQPVYREIKDWIVGCDNGARCIAEAQPEFYDSGEPLPLAITREPGPAGLLEVKAAQGAMKLDGVPLGPFAWSRPDEDGLVSISGPEALKLARALKDGRTLGIGEAKASLSGLAAVLLVMDDAQGRVGDQSALARPGPAPASATPAPPPLPVLHPVPLPPPLAHPEGLVEAVRKAQAKALEDEGCEDRKYEDGAEPLSRTEAVVIVTCLVGAYQASSLVFRVPRDAPAKARRVELPLPPNEPADASERKGFLTSASYDPKTATLGEWAKGRGLGDCGVGANWVFDGQDFQLADYSVKGRCGGLLGDLLPLWRTQVK